MEGHRKYAWPGMYCSQANRVDEINAELAELSVRHRPPPYDFIEPDASRLFIVVTKFVPAGSLIEIDYRMTPKTQLKRKFGPVYQEYLDRKRKCHVKVQTEEAEGAPKQAIASS